MLLIATDSHSTSLGVSELTGSTGLTNSSYCPRSRLLFSSLQSMRCRKMVTLNRQCLAATRSNSTERVKKTTLCIVLNEYKTQHAK